MSVLVVVSYDVSTMTLEGRRRLRQVSKACSGYGLRAQFSVFECEVDPAQWVSLKSRLLGIIDPDYDSLRFYHLGSNWRRRVEHYGMCKSPDHGSLFEV